MATFTPSLSPVQTGTPDPAQAWIRSFGRVMLLIAVCVVCGFVDVPLVLGMQPVAPTLPSLTTPSAASVPASRLTQAELRRSGR